MSTLRLSNWHTCDPVSVVPRSLPIRTWKKQRKSIRPDPGSGDEESSTRSSLNKLAWLKKNGHYTIQYNSRSISHHKHKTFCKHNASSVELEVVIPVLKIEDL